MPKLYGKTLVLSTKTTQKNYIEIRNQTENSAELYFYGDICAESWQSEWYKDDQAPADVVEFLSQLDGVETVHVHFNSGGGSVTGGIAIKNLLQAHSAKMIGYVDGLAASIAGVIAMACDELHVYSNSIFMMHKPLSYCIGNADDFAKEIEVLDTCQKVITNTFMEKAKDSVSEQKITDMINEETWLTGTELAEYFDNVIVEEETQAAASASSEFFDKYKNLPKNLKQTQPPEEKVTKSEIEDMISKAVENALSKIQVQPVVEDKETKQKLKDELLSDLDYI